MTTSIKKLTEQVTEVLGLEKTAKAKIGSLSRALLSTYHKGGEASLAEVTELIVHFTNGCTPANRKALTGFFCKYSAFKATNTGIEPSNLSKKIKAAKREDALAQLEDRTFNVWSHFGAKAEPKAPVDQREKLAKALKRSLEAKENALTVQDAMEVFLATTEVKPDELMGMLSALISE